MGAVKKLVAVAVTVGILLALNAGFPYFDPYWGRVVLFIGINITLAVSLNLINGITGQFSIGHAGFMAVGGYAAAYVTRYYGAAIAESLGGTLADPLQGGIVLLIGLLVGAAAAALAGLAVGIPSLRLKGDYLAIVTLGFGEIIRIIILNTETVGGPLGFTGVPPLSNFFWIFGAAVLTVVIVRNIATSTFGRALVAIREDEIAAEAMGIDTTRYKVLAFVISSALAGVAGGLFGHMFGNLLTPQAFTFVKSIEIIIMIVLGGIGSSTGAVVGAAVLTYLPERLRPLDQAFPGMRMVLYALVLILLMIFRPQGLLARREFGWGWLRLPSRQPRPVAITEVGDTAAGGQAEPPVDTRSAMGGERNE